LSTQESNIVRGDMVVTNGTPGSKSMACNESKWVNVGDPIDPSTRSIWGQR